MPPIDPQQLLKALGPLLSNTGGIKGEQEASRIASLMKSATKLVSRCIYLNILRVTDSASALDKFIEVGGWDILNTWLDYSRDSNEALLREILETYVNLPVTVGLLKQNSAAKTIKQLSKTDNEKVKILSVQLVDAWTKTIRGQNNNNKEDNDDKKKKEKEKDKDRHKKRDKDKEKNDKDKENDKKDSKDKDVDKKHDKTSDKDNDKHKRSDKDSKDHHHHRDRKDRHKDKERSKDKPKSSSDSSRSSSSSEQTSSSSKIKDSSSSSKSVPPPLEVKATPASSLTAPAVLPKVNANTNKEEESRRRGKTVKMSKFRSTGLLDEDDDDDDKKKPDKPPVKRAISLDSKSNDIAEKKPKLQLTMPTLLQYNEEPPKPEVLHGKIKIIEPPKRAPPNEIIESGGFMDALKSTTIGVIKKKKKMTSPSSLTAPYMLPKVSKTLTVTPVVLSPPAVTSPQSTEKSGSTSPPILSPTTAIAQKLPSVPSFYRDTLEDTSSDVKDKVEDKADSPPVIESMDFEPILPPAQEQSDADSGLGSSEGLSGDSKEGSTDDNDKDLSTDIFQRAKPGKPKKSVRWAQESYLEQYFYFELDENERENVNRPKSFLEMKREEMMFDRRAINSAKTYNSDVMVEILPWKRPKAIEDVIEVVEYGCNSKEKMIQTERERAVLCALFFNKIPDAPNEPDPDMSSEENDMKVIPLEDENGSCAEYEHTYDNLVDNSSLPYDPEYGDLPFQNQGPAINQAPMGMNNMGNMNMPPGNMGFGNLPPALNHLLNTLRQQAQQTRDPVMQNLQGMLTNVLQSTNPQDSGMLMERILNTLEQFKNQIPGLTNLIASVTNNGMGEMRPPAPAGMMGPNHVGVPRHGILGNHPPGFNQMGPGNNMRPNVPGGPNMQGGPGPMMGNGGGEMNHNYDNRRGPHNMDDMRMGHNMDDRMMGNNMDDYHHNMDDMRRGPMDDRIMGHHNMDDHRMGGPPPPWRGGRGRGGNFGNKRGHNKSRSVCTYFMKKGSCRYGDGCQFIHPGPGS